MRTLMTAVLAALLFASCIESNPQPAPGKSDNEGDPNVIAGEDANKVSPQESDAAWDGAVDLGNMDARPEPADIAGEVTDLIGEEISDIAIDGDIPFVPTDVEETDIPSEVADLQEEELPTDLYEAPDEMSADIAESDSQLVGGGSYFGECWGACKMDITIEGDQVNFVASNWDGTVFVDNDGTLTATGLKNSKILAEALVDVELEEVYGCPDCADGGGSYIILRRNGVVTQHDYPFGEPFPYASLIACDDFISELKTAMAGCQSTVNITVGEDCGPLG